MKAVAETTKKNLLCNFRAPNEELFAKWQEFKLWCSEHGRDICYVTLSLADSFMLGVKGGTQLKDPSQTINIQMNNQFHYEVSRPRREPYDSSCIRKNFRKTFSSLVYEAYVLNKAREINREVSFRDFLEMEPAAFHRIVRRLIRKGKMAANPQRSVPRFYFLIEKLPEYKTRQRQT